MGLVYAFTAVPNYSHGFTAEYEKSLAVMGSTARLSEFKGDRTLKQVY